MKLELKHLSPYLPYGLKYIHLDDTEHIGRLSINTIKKVLQRTHIKPILRPLSDLTEMVDYGTFKTRYWDYLRYDKWQIDGEGYDWDELLEFAQSEKGYDFLPHGIFQDLIKAHFDVFGLIDKGLAIDINTLDI